MLPLRSPRWLELEHGYGNAADLPAILQRLLDLGLVATRKEDLLFGYLCHQGSVYTATYAAAPIVLSIYDREQREEQIALLTFVAVICGSHDAAEVPPGLGDAFRASVAAARDHALALLSEPDLEKSDFMIVLASFAELAGHYGHFQLVDWGVGEGELHGCCLSCDAELHVKTGGEPPMAYRVAPHPTHPRQPGDTVWAASNTTTEGNPIVPREVEATAGSPSRSADDAFAVLFRLAIAGRQHEIANRLRYVFGRFACPVCGHDQSVRDFELRPGS